MVIQRTTSPSITTYSALGGYGTFHYSSRLTFYTILKDTGVNTLVRLYIQLANMLINTSNTLGNRKRVVETKKKEKKKEKKEKRNRRRRKNLIMSGILSTNHS